MIDFLPRLNCTDAIAQAAGVIRTTTPTDAVADLLAAGGVFRVQPDGAVLVRFGTAPGAFTFDADPAADPGTLAPLTPALVADHIDTARLADVLTVNRADIDAQAVADELARRARERAAQLAQEATTATLRRREATAEEAERARRRAELLAELTELDSTPAVEVTAEPGRRARWFRP